MNDEDAQELVTALERTIVSLAAKLAIAEGQVEQLTTRLALLTDELSQDEPKPKYKVGDLLPIGSDGSLYEIIGIQLSIEPEYKFRGYGWLNASAIASMLHMEKIKPHEH